MNAQTETQTQTAEIQHVDCTLTPREMVKLPLFAVLLESDALAPTYRKNGIVVIATSLLPAPGDLILMETQGKFGLMFRNADGDCHDGNGGFVAQGDYRTIGVTVAYRTQQQLQQEAQAA